MVTTILSSQQNYSGMSLAELKQKQAENAVKAREAAKNNPEIVEQYHMMDKMIENEIVKKSFGSNNNSIFGSSFQYSPDTLSLEDQDYSGMSLAQLKAKRAELAAKAQEAAESYPESVEQYVKADNKILRAIDIKKYGPVNGQELADIDTKISDLNQKIQEISQKRTINTFQSQTAAKNNPGLAAQYQFLDKKYESDIQTLKTQLKLLKEQRADFLKQNQPSGTASILSANNPNTNVLNILMMLLQVMFKS